MKSVDNQMGALHVRRKHIDPIAPIIGSSWSEEVYGP